MSTNPAIGKSVQTGDFTTNYLEVGEAHEGIPLLFIHGSGPGVSAYANWRLILPQVKEVSRVLAPDMIGFGYSDKPVGGAESGVTYGRELWTKQLIDFMDALDLEKVNLVGNSFGGSLAMSVALEQPERVNKIILMGSVGVQAQLPEALDKVWGYQPSFENMAELVRLFTYDTDFADDDLIESRYQASLEPGFQEAFETMFPAPRQNGLDDLSFPDDVLQTIKQPTLIVHGREDKIIPPEYSYRLINLIENAELHIFGKTGHWTQIEQSDAFSNLVKNFIED